jgi:hypothetical protein
MIPADQAILAAIAKPPGRMYEVNINARPDQFLDWDKKIGEQAAPVQSALRELTGAPMHETAKGSDAYWQANQALKQSGSPLLKSQIAQDLTTAFADRGIPGIKYLDQGSRGAQPLIDNKLLSQFSPSNDVEARAIDALRRNTSADEAISYLKQDAGTEAAQKWLAANANRFNQPQGTSNYVVFDDKLIDILRKYGIALPGAGAGVAAAQEGRDE